MSTLQEGDVLKRPSNYLPDVSKARHRKIRAAPHRERRIVQLSAKVKAGTASHAERSELAKLRRVTGLPIKYRAVRKRRRVKVVTSEDAFMPVANRALTVVGKELPLEPSGAVMTYEPSHENLSKLAAELRRLDIRTFPAWQEVRNAYPDSQLFAVDCSAAAIDLTEDGQFSGRADVLVSTKVRGLANKIVDLSLTIPARIKGSITSIGTPKVESVRLTVGR